MEKFYYLAAPYTVDSRLPADHKLAVKEFRIRNFAIAAARMSQAGMLTFSPLLNALVQQHAELPDDWNYWRRYSEALLDRSQYLVVLKLDGWAESVGVTGEREYAERIGVPVLWLDGPNADLSHLLPEPDPVPKFVMARTLEKLDIPLL